MVMLNRITCSIKYTNLNQQNHSIQSNIRCAANNLRKNDRSVNVISNIMVVNIMKTGKYSKIYITICKILALCYISSKQYKNIMFI